jgi:CO/xanthine dehydrogenase Mo-binding subunit
MYEEYDIIDPFTKEHYPHSIYHDSATLKVLGDTTVLRVDAGEKVSGQIKFANDIILPNLVFLKFKRCPYSHAKVTSLDVSKAKALEGVVDVIIPEDVADLVTSPPYEYVLQTECWLVGNEVAAVIAEDEDVAEEALKLMRCSMSSCPSSSTRKTPWKQGRHTPRRLQ